MLLFRVQRAHSNCEPEAHAQSDKMRCSSTSCEEAQGHAGMQTRDRASIWRGLNDLPVQGLSVTVSRTNFSYRDTHLQNVYAGLGWMTQLATAPPQPLPVMILMVEASLSCKTAHSKTSTRPCSSEALTCPAPSTEDSCMSYGTGSVILSPKS